MISQTLERLTKVKQTITNVAEDVGKQTGTLTHCGDVCDAATGRVWQFLTQLNTILPDDPASPLLLSTREKGKHQHDPSREMDKQSVEESHNETLLGNKKDPLQLSVMT